MAVLKYLNGVCFYLISDHKHRIIERKRIEDNNKIMQKQYLKHKNQPLIS
jgi:hypothetical protein